MDVDFLSVLNDPEYRALPEKQRSRVFRLLLVIDAAEPEPGRSKPRMSGPHGLMGKMARVCPCSEALARLMWTRWKESGGDWRVLYDHRTTPMLRSTSRNPLRDDFALAVMEKCKTQDISFLAAYRYFMEQLKKGRFLDYSRYKGVKGIPVGCSQTSIRFYVRKFIRELEPQKIDWKKQLEQNVRPFLIPLSLLEDQIVSGKLTILTKEQRQSIYNRLIPLLDAFDS